jgi:FixJ family two-component response regulator
VSELTHEAIERAKAILVFEQRVLQHRVEGLTAEQSAERLEVHASTVEACRKHLLLTDGRAWRAGKRGATKRQKRAAARVATARMR